MSEARRAFRDWRHRLRDLHRPEDVEPPRSWIRNLHARVLRYFIARYDFQPLPDSLWQEPAEHSAAQPALPPRMAVRVRSNSVQSPPRPEEQCKKLLSDIQSGNMTRDRHRG